MKNLGISQLFHILPRSYPVKQLRPSLTLSLSVCLSLYRERTMNGKLPRLDRQIPRMECTCASLEIPCANCVSEIIFDFQDFFKSHTFVQINLD